MSKARSPRLYRVFAFRPGRPTEYVDVPDTGIDDAVVRAHEADPSGTVVVIPHNLEEGGYFMEVVNLTGSNGDNYIEVSTDLSHIAVVGEHVDVEGADKIISHTVAFEFLLRAEQNTLRKRREG